MKPLSLSSLRLARRLRQRTQSGYALLTVLVATMVFGLMVMSLLTLVGTDARVQPTYFMSDAMKRSVDGGLQAGIAQVKAVPSTELKVSTNPCVGFAAQSFAIDDRTVDLTCTEKADAEPIYLPTTGDGGTAITTLQSFPVRSMFFGWFTRPNYLGGLGLDQGFANALLDAMGFTASNTPSFVHVGPNAATVLGGVEVANHFVGVAPKAGGSALRVDGRYQQRKTSEKACYSTWQDGHEWVTVFGRSGQVGNVVYSGTGSNAGKVNCTPTPAITTPAVTTPSTSGLPNRVLQPLSCPGNSVVRFEPGYYGPAAVAIMNTWFSAATCQNSVFWFEPGVYLIEGSNDVVSSSLTFADPTSSFVFGTWPGAATWTPGTGVYPRCRPDGAGVSVTLGPTTRLVHTAGEVSMCGDPATATSPRPVLAQRDSVIQRDHAWVVDSSAGRRCTAVRDRTPDGFTCDAWLSTPMVNATSIARPRAGAGNWDRSEGTVLQDVTSCTNLGCSPIWEIGGWDDVNVSGQSVPLSFARIGVTGTYQNINTLDPNTFTFADVLFPDGSKCTTTMAGQLTRLSLGRVPIYLDLLQCYDRVSGTFPIQESGDLVGITVHLKMNGSFTGGGGTLALDYVWLDLETSVPRDNLVTMNRPDGPRHAAFTAFGVVNMPTSNLQVVWADESAPPLGRDLPVSVGHLVLGSLVSGTGDGTAWRIGTLASRGVAAGGRQVVVRAAVGGTLYGTVDVTVFDLDASAAISPASRFEVSNWSYCNKPLTPDATCATP